MIDCCELALYNGKLALYIAISAFIAIALLLAMFFGYNLNLSTRTASLEKKNGSELSLLNQQSAILITQQKQIEQHSKEIKQLKEGK